MEILDCDDLPLEEPNQHQIRSALLRCGGAPQRLTFEAYALAKSFASATVQELADSRSEFITLRGPEAYEYTRSKELLASTGFRLLDSVTIAVESYRLLQDRATPLEELVPAGE